MGYSKVRLPSSHANATTQAKGESSLTSQIQRPGRLRLGFINLTWHLDEGSQDFQIKQVWRASSYRFCMGDFAPWCDTVGFDLAKLQAKWITVTGAATKKQQTGTTEYSENPRTDGKQGCTKMCSMLFGRCHTIPS